MTTVHKPRALYDDIKSRLESQTSKAAGKGKRPDGASPPYMVIHPSPDRRTQGSLTDPNQIRDNTFIVVYVGDTTDEAQEMQEQAQSALLGWSPTVSGFKAGAVELDQGNLYGRADPDGGTYEIADRYLVNVS